jgi:hypothetical protein
MFKHSTPTRHYFAVSDDTNATVKVFPTRLKADHLIRDFQHTKSLLKRGANPLLAFHPSVDVALLVELANRTTNLKIVELKENLSPGTTIKADHVSHDHWRYRAKWSLTSDRRVPSFT